MSAAFRAEPSTIEQSNYTDYIVPRIDITPETHVYFVESTICRAASANRAFRRPHRRSATRSTPPPANGSGHCRLIRSLLKA
jgi:hypothetical protein